MIKKKGVFFPGQEKCVFSPKAAKKTCSWWFLKSDREKVEYAFVLYHTIQNYKVKYLFSCFQTYNLKKIVKVLTIWLSPIYVSLAVSVIVHGFQNRLAIVKVCVKLKCLGKKSFKNVLAYTLQQIYICNKNI